MLRRPIVRPPGLPFVFPSEAGSMQLGSGARRKGEERFIPQKGRDGAGERFLSVQADPFTGVKGEEKVGLAD